MKPRFDRIESDTHVPVRELQMQAVLRTSAFLARRSGRNARLLLAELALESLDSSIREVLLGHLPSM
ncbi:hypothetical protein C7S13_5833 [Burkholderia cepacia]|nr:hypothetical protein [Burkholderia cepacia]